MKEQGLGGAIVNIVSKMLLVAGPKNVAYGTSQSASQLHKSRLMQQRLAEDKIRC